MPYTVTDAQKADVIRMKGWKPFLIVGGALNTETGEFRVITGSTMAKFNALARKGWHVFTVGQ